jgi:hypothetical protein
VAFKEKGPKLSKRLRILGPYIPYCLYQTKEETCAKFGSDRFRNVNLYKFRTYIHTNKQTNKPLYIRFDIVTSRFSSGTEISYLHNVVVDFIASSYTGVGTLLGN